MDMEKNSAIQKACEADVPAVVRLALSLWPDNESGALTREFSGLISRNDAAVFLACREGQPIGFAQCQLRHDYVEGTHSSPVGYLEGIFVAQSFRGRGYAGQLLSACESWAKSMGCSEFASDCELTNLNSRQFHLRAGFQEANRIICFTKKL